MISMRYYVPEASAKTPSHNSSLYGMQETWASHHGDKSGVATSYMHFPVPPAQTSQGPSNSNISLNSHTTSDSKNIESVTEDHSSIYSADYCYLQNYGDPTMHSALRTPSSYSSPPMFMSESPSGKIQDIATVSPLRPWPDTNNDAGASVSTHGVENSTESQETPANYSKSFSPINNEEQVLIAEPTNGKRRRRLELVEAGSERALYLEKNRKAANKCRNKQKREQEDLVQEARDVEHRNKALKVEVDMLKCELGAMMEVVGQHNRCSDSRLTRYVQREADRLASGGFCAPGMKDTTMTSSGQGQV